jgi:acid phosphatase (class A)
MKKYLVALPVILIISGLLSSLNAAVYGRPSDEAIAALIANIPPPPADDSIAGKADLETLLQIQKDRTEEQKNRAQIIADHTPFLMGAKAFGDWFTAENLPITYQFFRDIHRSAHPFMLGAKHAFERPRPYYRDDRIEPSISFPPNSSYPSGHSAQGGLWKEFLATAFPEHRAVFEEHARETMWARILAGVHFPTDTQAGYYLGETIAKHLLEADDVSEALEQVRQEIINLMQEKAQKE